MSSNISIQVPLDVMLEIATYGSNGRISEHVQRRFEKMLIEQGYQEELHVMREAKLEEMRANLSRTLGPTNMKKLESVIATSVEAIKIASRMAGEQA